MICLTSPMCYNLSNVRKLGKEDMSFGVTASQCFLTLEARMLSQK
jgi:hypothetical protein